MALDPINPRAAFPNRSHLRRLRSAAETTSAAGILVALLLAGPAQGAKPNETGLRFAALSSDAQVANLRAPKGLRAGFGRGARSKARVSWRAVRGAKKYSLEIGRKGFYGPFIPHFTRGTSIRVSYRAFPYTYVKSRAPYQMFVRGYRNGRPGARSSTTISARAVGRRVSVKKESKASSKANKCLKRGAAAGIATAATGAVVAVASAWIPGVNAVSAATVAAYSGGSGASAFVVCLAGL